MRHAGAAVVMLTLASSAGAGCSRRVDDGQVIGLNVNFSISAPANSDPVVLNVAFDGYAMLPVTVEGWTDLTQRRLIRFLPPDLTSGEAAVTVSATEFGHQYVDSQGQMSPGGNYGITLVYEPPDAGTSTATCPPDAGTDASHVVVAEAGVDAGHPADCGSDGSAGAPEVPPGPTCSDFCATFIATCGSTLGVQLTDCLNTCVGLGWEQNPSNASDRNTLTCRRGQAQISGDDPIDFCPAAWFTPVGECGGSCDAFCDAGALNCAGTALFSDPNQCRTTCRSTLTNDLTCRIGALTSAGLDPSSKVVNCMKASIAANGCT